MQAWMASNCNKVLGPTFPQLMLQVEAKGAGTHEIMKTKQSSCISIMIVFNKEQDTKVLLWKARHHGHACDPNTWEKTAGPGQALTRNFQLAIVLHTNPGTQEAEVGEYL